MAENGRKIALLTERKVTPQYIKYIRDRYHLSQNEMDRRMQYSGKSHMTGHCIANPEQYLKPRYVNKFQRMVAELEIEHGFYHFVETASEVKHLPKRIRFTKKLEPCLGHQEYCTYLTPSHYCDRTKECQELYKARLKRRRKK